MTCQFVTNPLRAFITIWFNRRDHVNMTNIELRRRIKGVDVYESYDLCIKMVGLTKKKDRFIVCFYIIYLFISFFFISSEVAFVLHLKELNDAIHYKWFFIKTVNFLFYCCGLTTGSLVLALSNVEMNLSDIIFK